MFFRVCLVAALLAAPALGGPWSNPSGSAQYFDWSGGGTDNDFYGEPKLIGGDTLVFTPNSFRAESIGGGTDEIEDRLYFRITAKPGIEIAGITINERGGYGISGSGPASVFATADITVTEVGGFGRTIPATDLDFNTAFPVTSGTGNWTATGEVDFTTQFPAWSVFDIEINNFLSATSSDLSQAYIQKTLSGTSLAVTIVPEPAGLVLFGVAALLVRRR